MSCRSCSTQLTACRPESKYPWSAGRLQPASTHLNGLLESGGSAHALAVGAQSQRGGALEGVSHICHRLLRHLGDVVDCGLQQAAHALENAEQRNVHVAVGVGGNLLLQKLVARQVAVAEVELDLRQRGATRDWRG